MILYELLTGLRPIDAVRLRNAAITEMVRIIQEEEPSKPSTRLSTDESLPSMAALRQTEPKKLMALLRGELDWVVMKCLEKQRDRRYDTANALVRDIQRYLTDEVVEARPPSASYRLQKLVRRNKGQVIAASLVLFVLLAGIVGTTWGLFEARRQEQLAHEETNKKEEALHAEAERVKERDDALKKEAERANERDAANDELKHRLGVSEMVLATAAFENRDVKLAAERLQKVPPAQRGWEWKYLSQQANGGIFTITGHKNAVTCVAFSPDGIQIATGSSDQNEPTEVKLWDARTGAFLLELQGLTSKVPGVNIPLMSLAFSPDSSRIVIAGGDDTVRVYSAKTGSLDFELRQPLASARCSTFSPDGARIVTAYETSNGNILKVWDVQTRKSVLDWQAHKYHITRVAFTPDGTRVVSGSADKAVKVWDAATGKMLLDAKGMLGHDSSLAISPDGKRLIAGRDDGSRVIDAQTGEVLLVLKPRPRVVQLMSGLVDTPAVAVSPDGSRIVTGGGFGTADASVWDARTGAPLLELHGHQSLVMSAAFSPDGTRIVTGSGDGTAKVWDARTGTPRLELEGFKPRLNCAAISGDGKQIVTGQGEQDKPGLATVWDARTGTPQFTLEGFRGMIRCVAVSPDGTRIITGGGVGDRGGGRESQMTGEARVWDARGKLLFELKGLQEDVTSVDFSRDGARIATGGGDSLDGQGREVKIWDARTGELVQDLTQPSQPHGFAIGARVSVAFSPDGTRLAVAGARSESSMGEAVTVWDTKTGKLKAEMERSGRGAALCVAFSSDGKRVAVGNYSATTNIWNADTGEPLLELKGHTGNVLSVAFSPDSGPQERIVTISTDKTTRVWDARTGTTLLELRGHSGLVSNVSFTADGSRILTACRASQGDPTGAKVIAWDVRDRPQEIELAGHKEWIADAVFSPDGNRVATASHDKTVKVWNARTGEVLLDLNGGKFASNFVAFSPDGALLVTGGEGVHVWDAKTGKSITDIKTASFPKRARFSIDGKWLVVEGHDTTVTLWDAKNGKEVQGERIPDTLPGDQTNSDRRVYAQIDRTRNLVRIVPFEAEATELAWRLQQAGPNVRRHRLNYLEARIAKDDFAAAFHYNLVPPDQRDDLLKQADAEAFATLQRRAQNCQSNGEANEALALYTEIANHQKDKLGPDAPETLETLQTIGGLHFGLDQIDLGVQMFESIVKAREAKLGRRHAETLGTLATLAMYYHQAGRHKEAIPLLEECYPAIEWIEHQLLEAYEKEGEHTKISNLVEQQLAAARKALPSDSVELAIKLDQCGIWLMKVNAFADAEKVLRECLAIRSQKKEEEIGPSAEHQCRLGAALLGQQKYAAAEPLLVQGYEGLKKQLAGQDPSWAAPQLVEACDRLVKLYEGMEKPAETKMWQAEREKHAPPADQNRIDP